jgi:hypothetical protein
VLGDGAFRSLRRGTALLSESSARLRRALRDLERRRLGHVVDPGDYAGCFAPRRIPQSGSLSLHAYGLAIDINAAANPQYADSRQDRRLVRAMEAAGFTWAGAGRPRPTRCISSFTASRNRRRGCGVNGCT